MGLSFEEIRGKVIGGGTQPSDNLTFKGIASSDTQSLGEPDTFQALRDKVMRNAKAKREYISGQWGSVEGVTGSAAAKPTSGGRTGATSSGTAVSVASNAKPLKTAAKGESEGGLLPSSFRTGPITSKTEVDRFVQNLQAERASGLSDTDALNAAVDHVYRLYGVDTQGKRSLNVLPAAGSQLLEDIVDRLGLSEAARSQAGIGSPYYGGVNSTGKGDYPFIRPWDERTTSEESRAFQQQERAEEFVGDVTPGKAALLGVGSGMNRVSTGLEQLKNILQGDLNPVQKNSMEYIGDVVNEKGSGLEKGLFSLTDNITAMAPSMLAGGPAGVMLTGLTSGANSYRGSRLEGYDAGESLLYGVVNGALESALQYALGGLKGLGKGGFSKALAKTPLKDTLSRATAKVIKSVPMQNFLKSAASYGGSMLDEGFEEYVQALLDPVVRNVILNEQNSFEPFSEDKLYAAMMGALTAGLMNAPSNLAQYTQNRRAGNRILQNGETDIALNQAAEIADPDTQLSRNIEYLRGRQESGKSVSPALLGKTMESASKLAAEKSTPAYVARSTGQALGIDENIIKTAEKLAENTGRRIEFVETLGGIDGMYDASTGTLTVAADTPYPIRAILKHELTHSLEGTKAYAELSDFVLREFIETDAVKSGLSLDAVVDAKIAQYADAGKTLSRDDAMRELVADYCASKLFTNDAAIRRLSAEKPGVARRILNWIRSLKTKIAGTAEEKTLARAEELYHEALMEPFSKGEGVLYSIGYTTDNRPVVVVEEDILKDIPRAEWVKKVKETISRKFSGGIPVGGRLVKVNRISKNEYINSRYSQGIKSNDGSVYRDKLKTANNLDEIVLSSTNYINEDLKHERKDNFKEFARGDVLIRVGGKDYTAKVIIGFTTGNQMVLYDVIDFTPAKFELKKGDTQYRYAQSAGSDRKRVSPYDPTVPQSTDGVNTSISKNTGDDTQAALGYMGEDTAAALKQLVEKYGAIKPGEAPARDVQIPRQTNDGTRVRQFVRTAAEAAQVPDSFVGGITQDVMDEVYNYVPISNQEAMNRAVNTVEKLGIDKALEQWEAAANGAKGVNKYDMALGEYLLTLAGKNNDPALASKLIVELSTLGTEAGQAVQALSMLKRMTPEGKLMALQRIADRLSRESKGEAVKIPEPIIDRMQRVNPTDTETADRIFHDGLVSLAEQVPPTLLDKWNAWRYLAMLGNPRTHIRNIVGNAVFTPVVGIKNTLAGAIEGAMDAASRAAGGKGIARTKTALAALPFTKRREYLDFARQSYRKNKEKLDSGSRLNPADIVRDNRPVFTSKLGKPVEAARKANSRAMQAEDGWFKRLHYERALMQYLAANKIDLSKLDAQTQNRAENYAMREAQKATFADDSAFANFLSHAAKSNKAAGLIIEGIVPFKKTPVNIAKRAIEYSPAGLLDTVTRGVYRLKKGDISAADFIDGLASGLTGTGIVALGMWLASKGLLTGGLGYDDEDELARLQGAQEYALNLDDTSYTLDWAAPAALPLFVGAEIEKLRQESKKGEVPFPKMLEALANLSEPMVNMSMLQGINDAIENVKYSDNELTNLALNTATGYLSQGIPTLFGQIARTVDDTRRRNYTEQGSAFPTLQTAFQRGKSKIPGLLQTQQPYMDAWGREEPSGNLAQRVFDNFISPGYSSRLQSSPMEEELVRLNREVGEEADNAILPSAASKSFTNAGDNVVLTAAEYTDYQKKIGQTSYELLSDLTGSAAYRRLSDEQKAKAVGEIYKYARDLGKKEILTKRGEGYTPASVTKKIEAAVRNGISVPDYLTFSVRNSELEADKKPNGDPINGSKKRKVEALIREMGVTGKQRQVLLALADYGSEAQRERILSGESVGSGSGYGYLETDIDKLLKGALS